MTRRREAIAAIRALRLASHELTNVCRTIVGGTEMAIIAPTIGVLVEDIREIQPSAKSKGVTS